MVKAQGLFKVDCTNVSLRYFWVTSLLKSQGYIVHRGYWKYQHSKNRVCDVINELTDACRLDVAKILLEADADRGESHCCRRTHLDTSRGPPWWGTWPTSNQHQKYLPLLRVKDSKKAKQNTNKILRKIVLTIFFFSPFCCITVSHN